MRIAIVTVAFNRKDSLNRLLKSLNNAYYDSSNVTLIISIDKSDNGEVEDFSDSYDWTHGTKIVDKHSKNLGLRAHMLSLRKWFAQYDAIIVLEDDIVVSPNFYFFAKQCVEKYSGERNIAGISLYSFAVNYQTVIPFCPLKDEFDAFFMNCAMSWGEVWMKQSWMNFYEWYLQNQMFLPTPNLPDSVNRWNEKSWLKYHTRYCIEKNKYFVYPYYALSTNFGDAGVHNYSSGSTIFQVQMQFGKKTFFNLPYFALNGTYYNGFFENKVLYRVLNLNHEELCLDLNGEMKNRCNKRFWLTLQLCDYKIVKSFGVNYRPLELNIILANPGYSIFLYDTSLIESNPYKDNRISKLYPYYLSSLIGFIRRYGFANLCRDICDIIKRYNLYRVFSKYLSNRHKRTF